MHRTAPTGPGLPTHRRPTRDAATEMLERPAPLLSTFHITLAALWLGLSLIAMAASTAMAQPPAEGRRGPPQEAFAACEGQAEGAAVTLTLPGGKTLSAQCLPTESGALAARPAGASPQQARDGHRGPGPRPAAQ